MRKYLRTRLLAAAAIPVLFPAILAGCVTGQDGSWELDVAQAETALLIAQTAYDLWLDIQAARDDRDEAVYEREKAERQERVEALRAQLEWLKSLRTLDESSMPE